MSSFNFPLFLLFFILLINSSILDYNGNVSTGHAVVSDITDVDSLEQALSTILENALASPAESSIANNDTCNTAFDDIIKSYERAGNFLLSTAKMLSRLKLKKSL